MSDVSVLVVDSDKDTLNFLTGMLVKKGFSRSIGVSTGGEIIDIINAKRPDILLLNIDMPGENPIDTLLKVKIKYPYLPVIILASPECIYLAEAAIKKGASSYIVKTAAGEGIADHLKKSLRDHRQVIKKGKCDILIVDDDDEISGMVKSYLESNGYICEVLNDTGNAISRLLSLKPKLVLLDIVMPGIDGMQFLSMIKKESPQTKVIMMSGVSEQDICINAIKNKASGYITKPFSLQQLKVTVATTLSSPFD